MFITSQILVVISGILFGASYLTNKKNILLILNIANNIFFGAHYLFLGELTAGYSVYLTVLFYIAIYLLEKFKKERFNYIVSIVSLIALAIITWLTWANALSILPVIGIAIVYCCTILKNILLIKIFNFISCLLSTTFMLIIHSYFGVCVNIVILITAIVGIVRTILKFKVNKNSKV